MKTKQSIPQKIVAYIKGNPIVVAMILVALYCCFTVDNFASRANVNNLASKTSVRLRLVLQLVSLAVFFSVLTTQAVCSLTCLK